MAKKQGKAVPKKSGDPDLMALGRRIRALRIKRGYKSAEKFALDHDLSRVHYGRWETGKKNITYKSLIILVKAFKVSLSQFFSEEF